MNEKSSSSGEDVCGTGSGLQTIEGDETDTITMSVTVDVSEMGQKDTDVLCHLARMYENAFQEVTAKNKDYGFSFLKTGCKLAQTDSSPFETPARAQTYGLLTRTGDKRERLVENVYGDGSTSVSDPAYQTAMENANYWMFMAFVLQNPQLAASFDGRSGDIPLPSATSD